jgi:hypothetical protein
VRRTAPCTPELTEEGNMHDHEAIGELQALDAVASEQGMVLAFRMCEESGDLEPVFLRIDRANGDTENEAALIAITDASGFSLGRYVIPRGRLDEALDRADEVDEVEPEPTVVPADWAGS